MHLNVPIRICFVSTLCTIAGNLDSLLCPDVTQNTKLLKCNNKKKKELHANLLCLPLH